MYTDYTDIYIIVIIDINIYAKLSIDFLLMTM